MYKVANAAIQMYGEGWTSYIEHEGEGKMKTLEHGL